MSRDSGGTWLPFIYRDFYDLPRAILMDHEGTAYFLECSFDEGVDEYPDDFAVYVLPPATARKARDPGASWIGLTRNGRLVGHVPVDQVHFDRSLRRLIRADVFALLDG